MMDTYITQIGVGVMLLLIGFVLKITTDTRQEVRKINGRIGKIEEWRIGQEKLGDERQETVERRFKKLEG